MKAIKHKSIKAKQKIAGLLQTAGMPASRGGGWRNLVIPQI
jgi:hypothetical protein